MFSLFYAWSELRLLIAQWLVSVALFRIASFGHPDSLTMLRAVDFGAFRSARRDAVDATAESE